MAQLNPVHIHAVIRAINRGPYFQLLSMPVTKMGPGFSIVETELSEKHQNLFGAIHGGVYASVIDTAAYWSVYSEIDEDVGMISLDLKVDFLAPINTGKIVVKGNRIKVGLPLNPSSRIPMSLVGRTTRSRPVGLNQSVCFHTQPKEETDRLGQTVPDRETMHQSLEILDRPAVVPESDPLVDQSF